MCPAHRILAVQHFHILTAILSYHSTVEYMYTSVNCMAKFIAGSSKLPRRKHKVAKHDLLSNVSLLFSV